MGLTQLRDQRPRTAVMILPSEATPLLDCLAPLFTLPTSQRFLTLATAAVLTRGRRTVANLLRTLGTLTTGHRTSFQRVFSDARWSGLELGCALAAFLLHHLIPDGPVTLVGDDTVDGHKGKKVYGKARHRDAVRSTHSYTAWRYGHRWVVLAVLVHFPFARRPWALPILIDLYRSREDNHARGQKHRTPAQLMSRLLRLLLIRFPDRAFVFTGHWYKAGHGLIPIRWVFVEDLSGTHREEYFFTTDATLSPTAIITAYTGRWNIETTFQECRSCLGLESTRGWCRATVLRAAPCLFGLYSAVAILYHRLPEGKRIGQVSWPGKRSVSFSDALSSVRRWLWAEAVFPQAIGPSAVKKLPERLRDLVLANLATDA